jgi:colanic acid/amylovoran biosynthesis protein
VGGTMKTILITGVGDTRNNGCWAMVASAITSIRGASPEPVRFILLNRKGATDHLRLAFPDVEIVTRPWTWFAFPKLRLLWILACATVLWLQARVRGLRFLFPQYWHAFERTDLVVDLSGDSISRDYSGIANLTVMLPLLTARALRRPYYLCAQSIGPFGRGRLDDLVLDVLRTATLITTREARTQRLLAEHGIAANVRRTEDLAFLLAPADPARRDTLLAAERIDPSWPWVGMSISSIVAAYAFADLPPKQRQGAYVAAMAQFADYVVDRYGLNVLFVPHVVIPGISDDRDVTSRVLSAMQRADHGRIVGGDYTGAELKAFIGTCRYFVGSRMHATIAALSQEIPTVTLAYNHKTLGINGEVLGQGDFLIDLRAIRSDELLARCVATFDALVAREAEIRAELRRRLPSIRVGAQQNAVSALELLGVPPPAATEAMGHGPSLASKGAS